MKIKALVAAAALSSTFLIAAHAQAATYSFDFTGPGLTADGSFVTSNTANSDGSFDVTSISGTADGSAINGIVPIAGNTPFNYDNEVFSTNPVVDNNGILFSTAAETINIYSNGPSLYADAKEAGGAITDGGTPGAFTISSVSAVPEPATWLLMIAGIGGIGLMLRRAKTTMGFRFKDAFAA